MKSEDVGCHVASLCAQAVEKSIKGYVVLNRSTPSHRSHRADKYLTPLLRGDLLRYGDHRRKLAGLFDPSMRALVRRLFDLTPGAVGSLDVPNTEYPWADPDGTHAPAGASQFADTQRLSEWAIAARRISAEIAKLVVAVRRVSVE